MCRYVCQRYVNLYVNMCHSHHDNCCEGKAEEKLATTSITLLPQHGHLLPTLQLRSSNHSYHSTAEGWSVKTRAPPHVRKIPHWRIFCVPLRHITYDNRELRVGLFNVPPESESRNLACWHSGEEDDLRPCEEPPAYRAIRQSYWSSLSGRTTTKKWS